MVNKKMFSVNVDIMINVCIRVHIFIKVMVILNQNFYTNIKINNMYSMVGIKLFIIL